MNTNPTLLIDPKKNRIRVHRSTLEPMGTPEYIWMLVNPDAACMALCASSKELKGAIKVKYSRGYAEFYSLALVNALKNHMNSFEENHSYTIAGIHCFDGKIARFRLKDAKPINCGEEVALVG